VQQLNEITWRRETATLGDVLMKYQLRLISELAKGTRVLDVGCNDGLTTKHLCAMFPHVVGLDGSEDCIKTARERVPEATFYTAMVGDWDTEERFDTILMINFVEHIDDPVALLRRCKRWLAEDGVIIIFVPNALSLNRRIGTAMGIIKNCYELTPYDVTVGHVRFYDAETLRLAITLSGLSVINIGGVMLKPFSNTQMEGFLQGQDNREEICEALYVVGQKMPNLANSIWAVCR
jgi:2-polyprenyl-3-methyl-5-hydroxy-6-metoxy-1,4-benzoquinol methylase